MAKPKALPTGLELRGLGYYAVRDVPRPLQEAIGKKRLVRSLKTRDSHVAKARRHAVQADFQKQLDDVHRAVGTAPEVEAGLAWREQFKALERGDHPLLQRRAGDDGEGYSVQMAHGPERMNSDEMAGMALDESFSDEIDSMISTHGAVAGAVMRGLASGTMTPLLLHVDAWLAEGGSKGPGTPRTQRQYRSDLTALAAWMKTIGVGTIEGVTKKTVGRYVTEGLLGSGMNRVTANRKISAPSAYWRWLARRGHTEATPWLGQSLSKGSSRGTEERTKRPFEDDEVARLFHGERLGLDPELADAMRVAALSGLRLEELYRLTVADCTGNLFSVRLSKSRAGVRKVPIHAELADLVARRTAGKAAKDFLFHEAGAQISGRERSAPLSKRFGRYRQTVGVHDRQEGRRHSACDFHSFRRWFITTARNAGVDRAVVAAVVGHEANGMTDGVYHGGPTGTLKAACVAAVRLP